ncbi:type I-E CRISPR-associated endonuclease Cas1e [Ornithinimicrobium cavernae]|uniref:type I-E CRISPR-associated endonuclease Cas1e n=1 Tax=Ornithinimicrobium cavernae TaxID=2666047 RepID=UPI000D697A73|nr:type I-E CRISPR-associated endonuclease Cas1e [Ornithinimicrobium cavernae]
MKPIPGTPPARVSELSRIGDRLSFVYTERSTIHRDANAVTVTDQRGVIHVPAATIGALVLGPGTRVTHQAMMLLADSGSTAVWVGEQGVRYYAHGRGLSRSSRWIEAQAAIVSNRNRRLAVARDMYGRRFPDEDVTGATMQQLRGREGARVKRAYRSAADAVGLDWSKRTYDSADFSSGDPVNQALSAATACLYGVVHAVVVALGCSPALGVVHTGHERSFVFDVADLYKTDSAIPVAFRIATSASADIPGDTRRAMRDEIHRQRLLQRCVQDIQSLLAEGDSSLVEDWDVIYLWDGSAGRVAGGTDYAAEVDVPW